MRRVPFYLPLGSGTADAKGFPGERKMKHFSREEWIDFVNQVTPAEWRRAMEKHLASGCKSCKETVSLWQKVRKQASEEAAYKPPADVVRLAKAAFLGSRAAPESKPSRGVVQLLFDSFAQPALAGARSAAMGTRQMLYRADPYQIDIQVEVKPASNRLVVTGQLLQSPREQHLGGDQRIWRVFR